MAEEESPIEIATDLSDISWDVPSSIKRRLGSTIIACSRLEHTVELVIWAFLNLNAEDGKMITARMDMNRRQAVMRELIARYPKDGVKPLEEEFWNLFQVVVEARNKIAHGVWVIVKGTPAIASTKWKGPKGHMALEQYPYEKLDSIEQMADLADEGLRLYAQRRGLMNAGFAPPRSQPSVIHLQGPLKLHIPGE